MIKFAFSIILSFFILLCISCLETPSNPEYVKNELHISVNLIQNGITRTDILQATPADSFELKVKTVPEEFERNLSYYFFKESKILSKKTSFKTDTSSIPTTLKVQDKNGNTITIPLHFIFNTTPELDTITIPADMDTLYGDESTAFTFSFKAIDKDIGDSIFYVFEADSMSFYTGSFSTIIQSGFKEGKHNFRIIATDLFGFSDTLNYKTFFVKDTSEVK